MASSDQAFRRYSDPLLVPVGDEPSKYVVDPNFFKNFEPIAGKLTSFRVFNPNPCCVRLRGVSATDQNPNPEFVPITLTTGWGFAPLSTEIAGTQYPMYMSAMYFPTPGIERPDYFLPLEVSYGIGI